jgi:hypothetical protein
MAAVAAVVNNQGAGRSVSSSSNSNTQIRIKTIQMEQINCLH